MSDQPVPDIIATHLNILFCGINPGLMSAATHHNFARPGNRFWKALHQSGLTSRLLLPAEQEKLLEEGMGITNFVTRASATAQELSVQEIREGAKELEKKVLEFEPRWLAVVGIDTYRKGFDVKDATVGLQAKKIGSTRIWLLPNPSGLNAHYSLEDFVRLFSELKSAVEKT
jgi:TDG/mug DNA glycosylase family protein